MAEAALPITRSARPLSWSIRASFTPEVPRSMPSVITGGRAEAGAGAGGKLPRCTARHTGRRQPPTFVIVSAPEVASSQRIIVGRSRNIS